MKSSKRVVAGLAWVWGRQKMLVRRAHGSSPARGVRYSADTTRLKYVHLALGDNARDNACRKVLFHLQPGAGEISGRVTIFGPSFRPGRIRTLRRASLRLQ